MEDISFIKLVSETKENGQRVEVDVIAPASAVTSAISEFYRLMSKVHGIDSSDHDQIRVELINRLGEGNFLDAMKDFVLNILTAQVMKQVNIDTMLAPGVHAESDPVDGEDYAFSVNITPRPVLTLTSIEPVHVERTIIQVEESDIDEQIDFTAQQFSSFEKAEHDDIRDGDFVIMDIDMLKNGHIEKDFSGVRRPIQVKTGLLPEAFIEGMIGMKPGDIRKVVFSMPTVDGQDEYKADIRLHEVQQKVVPVIDDEWVAKNLPQFGNVQGFRDYIRQDLESQKSLVEQQDFVYKVRSALEERLEGSIPDEMYQQAKDSLISSTIEKIEKEGSSLDEYLEEHDMAKDTFNMNVFLQASEFLRQNLALDVLVQEKGITATDDEIAEAKKALPPFLSSLSDEDFEKRGIKASLAERLKRDKALAWLLETAIVD